MKDYPYLRKRQDFIRSRRAAHWPDEEPDDGDLSRAELFDRSERRGQENGRQRAERYDRGLSRVPRDPEEAAR